MPEREKAVTRMAEISLGGPFVWNGLTGTLNDPRCTQEQWDEERASQDKVFERIVRTIDWQRILLEASIYHERNGHESNSTNWNEDVCGWCIQEALLATERTWLNKSESK